MSGCEDRGEGTDPSPPPMSSPEPSSQPPPPSISDNPSVLEIAGRQESTPNSERLFSVIDSLKQQVADNRCLYVKKRLEENKSKLLDSCSQLLQLSQTRRTSAIAKSDGNSVELAEVKKIPPYTTWIFSDKNQKTRKDQLVVGQRGEEALTSSNTEEEKIEEEDNKKEFNGSEDYILRMTIENVGSSDVVLDALARCVSRKPSEIKERYKVLVKRDNSVVDLGNHLFDKDLDTALDSFNKLFCRRCLVFHCNLHGCSQDLVFPAKKLKSGPDEENDSCGPHCYKAVVNSESASAERNDTLVAERALDDAGNKEGQALLPSQKPKSKRGRPRKSPLNLENKGIAELWESIEKSLYQKGLEIFGRNSCLIARNLLNGMKTCSEVFLYMSCSDNKLPSGAGDGSNSVREGDSNADYNETMGNEVRRRSRYPRKSAGYHLFRRQISEKKDQPRPQYNPCGCILTCGKDCRCNVNGTCCEKFCGCPKTCKNRYRGCHCAKSQCQNRQCPCFSAERECDPDVCRNCSINCGDGSLGNPFDRDDNYECMNMNLLLKQQKGVLLGPSDISGWGAFAKKSFGKNEYIGEYTGEVISHQEADKRGILYDRANQSFLFNLNDQLVIDAFRRGNKLKFANHSRKPNCYAKVKLVAGDHRIGIFAKDHIRAGEELFYDYCYSEDTAPLWARNPETSGSKEEAGPSSSGRARKFA